MTHLYEFFGALLGCTMMDTGAFPAYAGDASMYQVHKFMDINTYQITYFNEQVGLAALSFGVTMDDATAVGKALTTLFSERCSPPTTVIPAQGAQLQAICSDGDCSSYEPVQIPANSTSNMTVAAPGSYGTATVAPSGSMSMSMSSMMSGSMTMGMSSTGTMMASGTASASTVATAGAESNAVVGLGMMALAGAFAVLMA
jgi:hypothetical protein